MSAVAVWTRPKSVDPVTIRCPACHMIFIRALGTLNPQEHEPKVELECICKDRRCRKSFTVKLGFVGMLD